MDKPQVSHDRSLPYWVLVRNPNMPDAEPNFYSAAATQAAADELVRINAAQEVERVRLINASTPMDYPERLACVWEVVPQ